MQFYSIPDWATYIAQDETGNWYAYEKEPRLDSKYKVWTGGGKKEKLNVVVYSTLQKIK